VLKITFSVDITEFERKIVVGRGCGEFREGRTGKDF
jgi:hypothetical protein